jgi:hypothetical protein
MFRKPSDFLRLIGAALLLAAGGVRAGNSYNPVTGGQTGETGVLVQPAAVSFGSLALSEESSAYRQVLVRNATGRPLHIKAGQSPDTSIAVDDSSCSRSDAALAPGESCAVGIAWSPGQSGTLDTAISLHSEAGDIVVKISGAVQGAFSFAPKSSVTDGVVSSSLGEFDFSAAGPGTITGLLANPGNKAVRLSRIFLVAGPGRNEGLSIGGSCAAERPVTLEPGRACVLAVTWSGEEAYRTSVVIEHDGMRGVLALPVKTAGNAGGGGPQALKGLPPLPGGAEPAGEKPAGEVKPAPRRGMPEGDALLAIGGDAVLLFIDGESLTVVDGEEVKTSRGRFVVDAHGNCVNLIPRPGRGAITLGKDAPRENTLCLSSKLKTVALP